MADESKDGKTDKVGNDDRELSCWSILDRPPSPLDDCIGGTLPKGVKPEEVLKPQKSPLEKVCEKIASREGPYVQMRSVDNKPCIEVGWRGTF